MWVGSLDGFSCIVEQYSVNILSTDCTGVKNNLVTYETATIY